MTGQSIVLALNSKASDYIGSSAATKIRIDASMKKAEGPRLRPTNRKEGPHLLLNVGIKGKGMVIEIGKNDVDKMVEEGLPDNFFQHGAKYSLINDKYGWLVCVPGVDHDASIGFLTVGPASKR